MHQRSRVQHFHYGSKLDGAGLFVGKQFGCEQQEHRTYPLASARAQVLADIGDRAHTGHRIAAKFALNRRKVVTQQLENFFGSDCGR
jgi:hypothetical protein